MADTSGALGTVNKWLGGLIGLGFAYLVLTNGAGVAKAFGAAGSFLSNTEGTVLRGGR